MAYILLIDDDEDFTNAAATVLRSDGHEIRIELDIHSGASAMEQRVPDLVVLDVMFPEDSSAGFELARNIRKYDNELRNVPILMLTAVNQEFPLGFNPNDIDDNWLPVQMFLEKPVDLDLLKEKVRRLLEQTAEKKAE